MGWGSSHGPWQPGGPLAGTAGLGEMDRGRPTWHHGTGAIARGTAQPGLHVQPRPHLRRVDRAGTAEHSHGQVACTPGWPWGPSSPARSRHRSLEAVSHPNPNKASGAPASYLHSKATAAVAGTDVGGRAGLSGWHELNQRTLLAWRQNCPSGLAWLLTAWEELGCFSCSLRPRKHSSRGTRGHCSRATLGRT